MIRETSCKKGGRDVGDQSKRPYSRLFEVQTIDHVTKQFMLYVMSTCTDVLENVDEPGGDASVEDEKAALIQMFCQSMPQSPSARGSCEEHVYFRDSASACDHIWPYLAICCYAKAMQKSKSRRNDAKARRSSTVDTPPDVSVVIGGRVNNRDGFHTNNSKYKSKHIQRPSNNPFLSQDQMRCIIPTLIEFCNRDFTPASWIPSVRRASAKSYAPSYLRALRLNRA